MRSLTSDSSRQLHSVQSKVHGNLSIVTCINVRSRYNQWSFPCKPPGV
jgi:hypothetical protein